MSEDFESILVASSTQLKTLNTRISQKACKDLDTIRGWLQTAGQLRAITKQDTVVWAIRYACHAICEQMESKGYITIQEPFKPENEGVMSVSDPCEDVMSVSEPQNDLDVKKVIAMHRLPKNADEIKARYGIR